VKTIYQLFSEFKQLKNPTNNDYMKLGHDLATNIVFAPENQQELLWNFIKSKFTEDKIGLINYGAKNYSKLQVKKEKPSISINTVEENIVLGKKPVSLNKEEEPILEIPVEEPNKPIIESNEIKSTIEQLNESIIDPREKEHKELIDKQITQVKENIEKLDNALSSLKKVKDPGFAMKKAVEALDKYKDEVNSKYKKPKP
jgi:hypothetical protein